MFQFPSNGKDFLNTDLGITGNLTAAKVSIPFKREGLPQQAEFGANIIVRKKFQFPSNGKDFLNDEYAGYRAITIGFQFPSNGKDFLNKEKESSDKEKFQFPSNGKDFLNIGKKNEKGFFD